MFRGNRSSQQNKRTGTSFFRKITGMSTKNIPSAPEPTRTTQETVATPSYAFVSDQRGEVDTRAEARGKEDQEIRESEGKNKADTEQPVVTFKPETNKVSQNEPDTQASTSKTVSKTHVFTRYWKLEEDYDLEEVIYNETNYWIPNGIAMFEILNQSAVFTRDNRIMRRHHPEYLDYAVACYYSVLFYIQILRAQEAAGRLTGFDRSFFKRFRDRYKLEELPISSIMQPYFSTIVSTLPADSQYGWIVPRYMPSLLEGTNTGTSNFTTADFTPNRGAFLIQPFVPAMLMLLRKAISPNRYEDDANPGRNYDINDQYIPVPLSATADTRIFHSNIRIGVGANRNAILHSCGLRYPFMTNQTELEAAVPKWRRSAFVDLKYIMHSPSHNANNAGTTSKGEAMTDERDHITHLEDFLFMGKADDLDFFEELINQAALNARFFTDSCTLSDIPTTSGNEPLVLTRMSDIRANAAIADREPNLGLNTNAASTALQIAWYPPTMREFRGGFMTSRAHVDREEALQAFTFGTNASFSIVDSDGNRLGDNNQHNRTGSFWQNQHWRSEFRSDLGARAKPMFKGWRVMYQEDAAIVRPSGY